MQTTRDTYLDFFKGVLILSVINIHTVYWSLYAYLPDIVRQLSYFVDIPIFFFFSGYLSKSSRFLASGKAVIRQYMRLYLTYLCISFLLATTLILCVYLTGNGVVSGIRNGLLSIFDLSLSGDLWSILKGYSGSLWYIRVYFSLLIFVPLLIGFKYFKQIKLQVLLFVFLLYSLTMYQYTGHFFFLADWGKISFYAIFFVLGAIYKSEETTIKPRYIALSLGYTCILLWMIYHFDNNTLLLSRYKFPPSYQYLVYSLPLLHVFILLRPLWESTGIKKVRKFLLWIEWSGKHSYVLYLIQGAICSLPSYFVASLHISSATLLYLTIFSFNVMGTILLSFVYVTLGNHIKNYTKYLISARNGKPLDTLHT